jgi:iron-sulfur cluster repair protein YtfE (RIC family)
MKAKPTEKRETSKPREIRPESTVEQIVAHNPETIGVFAAYRIDLCCGGKLPLTIVAEKHHLSLPELLAELEKALALRR